MSNLKNTRFSDLLNAKFIYGPYKVAEVCRKLNIPPSTFYKWLERIYHCPPDYIPGLYNATGDIDFLNFVLKDTDMMPTPRPKPHGTIDIEKEALDPQIALGEVLKEVRTIIAGKKITYTEVKKITNLIALLQKETEELKNAVINNVGQQRELSEVNQ